MKLNDYLDIAEKKAGKKIELARILGISDAYLRLVRNEKRGLAIEGCILLADYIDADRLEVIAASNLVTEKDERKRKIIESCFSTSRAASFTATALLLGVILIMTPSPAHASWATVSDGSIIEYFVLRKRGDGE
ncbi:hypothetical protein [Nitrosomonas sp.]|uniref:hypothetical protein n=1 Tax=Nitrosomonas sp. TaxID=42353 RepID=UPI0032ECCFA8